VRISPLLRAGFRIKNSPQCPLSGRSELQLIQSVRRNCQSDLPLAMNEVRQLKSPIRKLIARDYGD
jgi:hypothetical protein